MSGSAAEQPEEQPPQEAPDPERSSVEDRARNMGWVPRDRWTSRQPWVDAPEFIAKAEKVLPMQNERLRVQGEMIDTLNRQLSDQGATLNTIVASMRRAEQVGYRRALQELEARRDQAVERGDMSGFRSADREMRELPAPPPEMQPMPPPQRQGMPQQPQQAPPEVQAFIERNPWFYNDRVANQHAIAQLDQVRLERPHDNLDRQLEEVERRMARHFPYYFPQSGDGVDHSPPAYQQPANPRRNAPPMVSNSSGSGAPRRPAPRSFEAMPQNVKDQFERQKKMLEGKGEPLTKEEWSRYYYEQFEDEATPAWAREGS